jgi:acetyltransferase
VSQSGALVTAVLDWAKSRGIGFTKFICLGDSADVDCGDVLDYLGSDPETHAVLLHIEAITGARKFMSAARGAAQKQAGARGQDRAGARRASSGCFSHRRWRFG